MKKTIAVILVCILLLPVAMITAFARETVHVYIPSDVAGLDKYGFEEKIKESSSEKLSVRASIDYDYLRIQSLQGTFEEGQVYYFDLLISPENTINSIFDDPDNLNLKIDTGKGITVTKTEKKSGYVTIYGKIIVDGGSAAERTSSVFQHVFQQIKTFFASLREILYDLYTNVLKR